MPGGAAGRLVAQIGEAQDGRRRRRLWPRRDDGSGEVPGGGRAPAGKRLAPMLGMLVRLLAPRQRARSPRRLGGPAGVAERGDDRPAARAGTGQADVAGMAAYQAGGAAAVTD